MEDVRLDKLVGDLGQPLILISSYSLVKVILGRNS
ncbi:hypothetical protein COLO4_24724 [Corchorus olitorius]|uniref:Uncharacterized protein n=1 Tax=Corchorus olitorius TaxID=93759 RepID=A0A1R3I7F9_9ROSI|nr:hypothetical protein COLO4_24724 [Corchorus olitorius]